MRLLPWVGEHALQVDLLVTVGAGLLLADDAPAANAELVELVSAGQAECVLDDPLLPRSNKQLVATNCDEEINNQFS